MSPMTDDDMTTGPRGSGVAPGGGGDGTVPSPGGQAPPARSQVRRAGGDRRRRLRGTLEMVGGQGVIVLNDRRIPGSKATITMIAVAPAGVFVIDARHHRGLVRTKRPGTFDQLGAPELHVGRRNCTPTLEALSRQVTVVRASLDGAPWGTEVPVTPMLCLTRAEWGLASSALVRDVWVGWPRLLAGTVQAPGIMDSPTVQEVAATIGARLPAA
jgi:hypothetical protein